MEFYQKFYNFLIRLIAYRNVFLMVIYKYFSQTFFTYVWDENNYVFLQEYEFKNVCTSLFLTFIVLDNRINKLKGR